MNEVTGLQVTTEVQLLSIGWLEEAIGEGGRRTQVAEKPTRHFAGFLSTLLPNHNCGHCTHPPESTVVAYCAYHSAHISVVCVVCVWCVWCVWCVCGVCGVYVVCMCVRYVCGVACVV